MLERVPRRLQYELSQNRTLLTGAAVLVAVALGLAAAYITVNVSLYAGFGAVAAGLLGLAIMTNTQTGFVTVIAVAYLLPFAVIPAAVGGVKLTFLDATLTLLLIVWILRLLTHREERLVSTPLDLLILLFIGIAVTSFIMGVYSVSGDTIRAFLKTINSIVFFFVLVNNVRNLTQTLELVRALTIAAAVASFFAIALYLLQPEAQQRLLESLSGLGYPTGGEVVRYIADTDTLRAVGTSIDPNVLGGMLMLALPLVLVQLFGSAPLLPRRVLALIAVAVLSCLILTFSRSSWIGALAGVVFLGTFKYRRIWLALLVAVTVLLMLPQGEIVRERTQQGIAQEDLATKMRLGEYKDAVRLIKQYPWFGVGFGEAPSIDLYVAASSIYLMMAEEMGLIGLSAFIITMLGLFFYALTSRPRIRDPLLSDLQLGCLASVAGALTAGIFDHYFFNLHFPHTVALFWLFAGLAVVCTRLGLELSGERAATAREGVDLVSAGLRRGRLGAAPPGAP